MAFRVVQAVERVAVHGWRDGNQESDIQVQRRARADVGSEGKTAQPEGVVRTSAPDPFGDREQVVGFAVAIVESALTGPDAAEIEANRAQSHFPHGALQDGDDLVVHGAAMFRVRMADDDGSRPFFVGFRHFRSAFENTGRSAQQELAALAGELAGLLHCPCFWHGFQIILNSLHDNAAGRSRATS